MRHVLRYLFTATIWTALCRSLIIHPALHLATVPAANQGGNACLIIYYANSTTQGGLGVSYVRGGRTDKSWRSEACPAFCGSEIYAVDNGSGVLMFTCAGDASDTFCCVTRGFSTCNCSTIAEVIRFNSNGSISGLGECRLSKSFIPNTEDQLLKWNQHPHAHRQGLLFRHLMRVPLALHQLLRRPQ